LLRPGRLRSVTACTGHEVVTSLWNEGGCVGFVATSTSVNRSYVSETSPPGTRGSTSTPPSAPAAERLGVTIVNRTALRAAARRRAAALGSDPWAVVEGAATGGRSDRRTSTAP